MAGSTGDLVSTMLTNDDGVAMSESLLVGDYMVKEHEAPVGYGNSLWSEKVTVVMDETVERSVTNIPMQGQVRIVKTDAETGGSLAGAVFTVIRVSGLPSHGKEGCGGHHHGCGRGGSHACADVGHLRNPRNHRAGRVSGQRLCRYRFDSRQC